MRAQILVAHLVVLCPHALGVMDSSLDTNTTKDRTLPPPTHKWKVQSAKQFKDALWRSAAKALKREANRLLGQFLAPVASKQWPNAASMFPSKKRMDPDVVDKMVEKVAANIQNTVVKVYCPKKPTGRRNTLKSYLSDLNGKDEDPKCFGEIGEKVNAICDKEKSASGESEVNKLIQAIPANIESCYKVRIDTLKNKEESTAKEPEPEAADATIVAALEKLKKNRPGVTDALQQAFISRTGGQALPPRKTMYVKNARSAVTYLFDNQKQLWWKEDDVAQADAIVEELRQGKGEDEQIDFQTFAFVASKHLFVTNYGS